MRILLTVLSLLLLAVLFMPEVNAQCPMCRMTAESNYADGGSAALGLNKGIVYLFLAPYLIVGGIAYLYWKNNRSKLTTEEHRD
nr:hypothetical protein [Saprospiraceae bacterium]